MLSTDLATPLAVALAELLTNAVEHAFIDFGEGRQRSGRRRDAQSLARRRRRRWPRFATTAEDSARTSRWRCPKSLGLSIVRDIIRAQLHGTIEMKSVNYAEGGGTYVRVAVPLSARP